MLIQVKPGECVGMEWYEYVLRAEVSWTSAYILVYDGAKRRRYQAQHYKKIDCYSIKKRKDITGIVSYRSLVACMDHVVTLCWLVCEDRCVIILVSQDYKMPYVRHRCVLQVEIVSSTTFVIRTAQGWDWEISGVFPLLGSVSYVCLLSLLYLSISEYERRRELGIVSWWW